MNNPVILIAIPLLLGFLSILLKDKRSILLGGVLLNIISLFLIEKGAYMIGGFLPPAGITLVLDAYSFIGVILINTLFAISILMSYEGIKEYGTVLLIALAGLNGLLLTDDLFNLFVFLEITAITGYILSAKAKKYHFSLNYLTIGTIGSGLYLFGLIILYGVFGNLNMTSLKIMMTSYEGSLLLPTILIFAGLAVETKLLPFNGWVRGVYGHADQLVASLLSSVYAGAMLLVFGRLFADVFSLSSYLVTIFAIIAVVTIFAGEMAAFSKTRIREILLYSSVGQSGLVALLFITGLVFPAIMQLINNVVNKLLLFTITGKVAVEAGSDEKKVLQGIFRKHKLIGIAFTTSVLSLIGLPVFYGFISKVNLLLGLFHVENYWAPAIIMFTTVVEGAYFLRLLVTLWTPGEEGETATEEAVTRVEVKFEPIKIFFALIISILVIGAGVFPGIFMRELLQQDQLLQEASPSYLLDVEGGV